MEGDRRKWKPQIDKKQNEFKVYIILSFQACQNQVMYAGNSVQKKEIQIFF